MNQATRRQFIQTTGLAAGALLAASHIPAAQEKRHIASNAYSWHVFYARENRDFNASLDEGLGDVAASGLDGFEPTIGSPEQIETLVPLLKKHNLEMRSIYVGSLLHEAAEAPKSIEGILTIAKAAKAAGVRIVVTNPNPLAWGAKEGKSDAQLQVQARAMNALGKGLKEMGLTLSYHNHDMELLFAAREFHHMMVGTDPELVTLCLDSHWIYRGSGNSAVALMDVIQLYGDRVSELHLRQSHGGVWSETLGEGDLDYPAVAATLKAKGVSPHLVMEIAVETGTPKTLNPVEAHRQSADYAHQVFG